MEVAELQESCARIRGATKTRTLFFYLSIVRYSPDEENRQSEKLHSTPNSHPSRFSELFAGHVGGSGFLFSARAENRSDDRGRIHRLLSRSLFFRLPDQPASAENHTPYHQQTLGTSCLPWSSPHRVSCQLSDSIVAWGYGWVNKVEKQIKDNR